MSREGSGASTHDPVVAEALALQVTFETVQDHFAELYMQWLPSVKAWIRALGAPTSERDDLAQDVFMVVQRKLANFDGKNEAGWLYRITARTVSDRRRRAWFRHLFTRTTDDEVDALEAIGQPDPLQLVEEHQSRVLLARVLAAMSERLRTVLVLFEIEEYSGEQIATLMNIPVATVWTRLHRARKEFVATAAKLRGEKVRR